MSAGEARQPNFALLLGLAWLVIVAQLLIQHWSGTADTLYDTDDALRLVQMRSFLAGQGWFDLHESRLGPPLGYDSHWSRLIDAGLAGLFLLFHQFTDTTLAERLTRVVWPMLWLLPAMIGAVAITWRLAGRNGALVGLLLIVVGMPAFQQFVPGRIDHHNVQIAFSVLAVAAAAWLDRVRWAAYAAGGLTGIAMAIGLECLPFLALSGAAFVLRYVFDRSGAAPLAAYGLALAASALIAFFIGVNPAHWGRSVCDAIAINWIAPVTVAGLLSAFIGSKFDGERMIVRGAAAAVIGSAAAMIFVLIEPRCLGGPYAMMDPALRAIWFSYVSEMQPLAVITRNSPPMGAAIAAFPSFGLIAALMLARERDVRSDPAFLLATAALLVASAMMLAAAKICFYALWFGMPLVAAAALRIFDWLKLPSVAARAFVAILLTPSVMSATAMAIAQVSVHAPVEQKDVRVLGGCFKTDNYTQLARLPRGIIAADIDYGSFILALTPHSVLAAPYHRLSASIIAARDIFALPPVEAHRIVDRIGVAYIVTCGEYPLVAVSEAERSASVWGKLKTGEIPDWLELMPREPGQVFAAYRVVRTAISHK